MVLVSLDRASDLLEMIQRTGRFGLNVLAHTQPDLALRFASKGKEKFTGVPWSIDTGLPRLSGVGGWLACDVDSLVEGGDHIIAIGRVVAADHATDCAPLTYYRRTFGTHALSAA